MTDMTYAIIKVAGKQYRVREGERLLVDRLAEDDGATFSPTVLLVGGDGTPVLEPSDVKVTAKVLGAVKGPKIRIGKYKKRTGLPSAHGLPLVAHADRDRVDRRQEARDGEAEGGGSRPPKRRPSSRRSASRACRRATRT